MQMLHRPTVGILVGGGVAATLDLIRKYRVALKGPCTTPIGKGFRSINVRLRETFEALE